MNRLPGRFIEDRALRDAARAVLTDDIEHLRASLSEQGIASRVSTGVSSTISARMRTGAHDLASELKAQAGERKGVIALLVAAVILWFSRGSLLELAEELLESDFDDEDPAPAPASAHDEAATGTQEEDPA